MGSLTTRPCEVAVIQNLPLPDKAASVRRVAAMVEAAAAGGADLVVLPEIFYHPYHLDSLAALEEADGHTIGILAELARSLGIHLCAGSTVELVDGRRYNQSSLISPVGEVLLTHRKCHLFDVDLPGLKVRESAVFSPGDKVGGVAETLFGGIGILICYDIRFPEAARLLADAGADIIIVPAVFNTVTGPAHWEITFRCRAVENQAFVIAASPARDDTAAYQAYGHSMIVDPWGEIMAEAGVGEGTVTATLDQERLREVRARLPLLKHRRW